MSLTYSRNFKSNWLPCPSNSKNGGMLSNQSYALRPSLVFSISVNNSAVTLPFSEQQQKVGIFFPMNSHLHLRGCHFPVPVFLVIASSLPAQGVKGSRPSTHAGSSSLAAKITRWSTCGGCKAKHGKVSILCCCSYLHPHFQWNQKFLTPTMAIFCL